MRPRLPTHLRRLLLGRRGCVGLGLAMQVLLGLTVRWLSVRWLPVGWLSVCWLPVCWLPVWNRLGIRLGHCVLWRRPILLLRSLPILRRGRPGLLRLWKMGEPGRSEDNEQKSVGRDDTGDHYSKYVQVPPNRNSV